MAQKKGFHDGVKAMKETLAKEFERLGGASVTCTEAAHWIRSAPGPKEEDGEEKKATV